MVTSPKYAGEPSAEALASGLATLGRYGDEYMVHAAEGETMIPAEVFEANPGLRDALFWQMQMMGIKDPNRFVVGNAMNSINPITGQPEFWFKKIFKKVKGVFKTALPVLAPLLGNLILPGLGGLIASGLVTKLSGGSWGDVLRGAAIGWATQGLTSGIGSSISGGSFLSGVGEGLSAPFTAGANLFTGTAAQNPFRQGILGGMLKGGGSGVYHTGINAAGKAAHWSDYINPRYNPNAQLGSAMPSNLAAGQTYIQPGARDADIITRVEAPGFEAEPLGWPQAGAVSPPALKTPSAYRPVIETETWGNAPVEDLLRNQPVPDYAREGFQYAQQPIIETDTWGNAQAEDLLQRQRALNFESEPMGYLPSNKDLLGSQPLEVYGEDLDIDQILDGRPPVTKPPAIIETETWGNPQAEDLAIQDLQQSSQMQPPTRPTVRPSPEKGENFYRLNQGGDDDLYAYDVTDTASRAQQGRYGTGPDSYLAKGEIPHMRMNVDPITGAESLAPAKDYTLGEIVTLPDGSQKQIVMDPGTFDKVTGATTGARQVFGDYEAPGPFDYGVTEKIAGGIEALGVGAEKAAKIAPWVTTAGVGAAGVGLYSLFSEDEIPEEHTPMHRDYDAWRAIEDKNSPEAIALYRKWWGQPFVTRSDFETRTGKPSSKPDWWFIPEDDAADDATQVTANRGGEVMGAGTGTSDSIPARLSDGEFVMTANAVRNAGNGNRNLGAARMYDMMRRFEGRAA